MKPGDKVWYVTAFDEILCGKVLHAHDDYVCVETRLPFTGNPHVMSSKPAGFYSDRADAIRTVRSQMKSELLSLQARIRHLESFANDPGKDFYVPLEEQESEQLVS